MTQILVSHPHAVTNANEAAGALDRAGLLARYVVGIGAAGASASAGLLAGASRWWPELRNRIVQGVRPEHLTSLSAVEVMARLTSAALARTRIGPSTYDALFVGHDLAVAALPWPRGMRAVYAYEDGALATFRRARRAGLERIWDLPTPHHRFVERVWRSEARRWPSAMGERTPLEPAWKKRRKDGELALATAVCVASEFTRQSLLEAGVAVPVLVVPYGFPVELFAAKPSRPAGPFTVVAVGSHDARKGTPWLLEAWRRAGIADARLRLVGRMRLTSRFLERYRGSYEHVSHVARAQLVREYQAADLLAFPTLADGFGMVMQEAMCCGTPVVTTRCGGGPECIDPGRDGWILPERDIDAWVEFLRYASANRDVLHAAGAAARKRAERYSWADAGRLLLSRVGAVARS